MDPIKVGDKFTAIGIDQYFIITGFKKQKNKVRKKSDIDSEDEHQSEKEATYTDYFRVEVYRNGVTHKDKMIVSKSTPLFLDTTCYVRTNIYDLIEW